MYGSSSMSDELLQAEMVKFWNDRNAIALLCLGGQAIHVSLLGYWGDQPQNKLAIRHWQQHFLSQTCA